jgi:hypothetical protein
MALRHFARLRRTCGVRPDISLPGSFRRGVHLRQGSSTWAAIRPVRTNWPSASLRSFVRVRSPGTRDPTSCDGSTGSFCRISAMRSKPFAVRPPAAKDSPRGRRRRQPPVFTPPGFRSWPMTRAARSSASRTSCPGSSMEWNAPAARHGRAFSATRGASKPTTSREICLLGRLHGIPTPVNGLLQRLSRRCREGKRPGSISPETILAQLGSGS